MKLKKIKKNMVNWIKKISYNSELVTTENYTHCPNFATRCCLTCNNCWRKSNKKQPVKDS